MNGQTFWQVIGCILNITSSMVCDAGHNQICLMQHVLEKHRAMLQKIKNSPYKCLSCQKVLKHLGAPDLSIIRPQHRGANIKRSAEICSAWFKEGLVCHACFVRGGVHEGMNVPAGDWVQAKYCKQHRMRFRLDMEPFGTCISKESETAFPKH